MFRIFENAVTPFNRLGSQQSPVGTNAHSTRSPASIKPYEEDTLWLAGIVDSSRHDPTSVPKAFRPRALVETVTLPTPRETLYVAEPSPIDLHRGLGPRLSKLPAEIRNIIYADLLSSGHPQFLRASKATHAEGSGLAAANGRYRLSFGFPNHTPNHSLPSQRVVDAIRNLDVRADASAIGKLPLTQKEVPDLWLLRAFGGSGIVRGRCDVGFEVHPYTSNICVHRICRCLRLLSDFETVVVRVEVGGRRDPVPATKKGPVKSLRGCVGAVWAVAPRDGPPVCWSEFHLGYIYGWVRKELEWFLGKGHLGRDEVGLRLVFHPREALEGVGEGWTLG
ncbi:MAG: hypothetical protein ALECFALPRED_000036 [Alectoria fallacina]|uniref:Uncharacterized protein n=1 Tax=Alectoria fallacina TaxID=1903189 RepID=A0A8H3EF42_9LECA|nr:MAG: hypothetical protein ALECFALPRED_000036 [Alectoria fallacina]